MPTAAQIEAYIARTFDGTRAQVSHHSRTTASAQVFLVDGSRIADVDLDAREGAVVTPLKVIGERIKKHLADNPQIRL